MFPKQQRMNVKEVSQTRTLGNRFSSEHTTLYLGVQKPIPHISVIVPKRLARTARTRHIHKRRLTHILKTHTLQNKQHVFTLRKSPKNLSYSELQNELQTLLDKAHKSR